MPAVSPECFYLHIDGEQRGPYTISQIDHLLNSGLIREETTYWREGMEQWQPVTDLVQMRESARPWLKRSVLLGALVLLVVGALFARVFGPVTLEGWRETAQYEYTPRAAYWRARDAVRQQATPAAVINFGSLKMAKVEMRAPDAASVWLPAEVTGLRGGAGIAAWRVELRYDARARLWTPVSVKPDPLGQPEPRETPATSAAPATPAPELPPQPAPPMPPASEAPAPPATEPPAVPAPPAPEASATPAAPAKPEE